MKFIDTNSACLRRALEELRDPSQHVNRPDDAGAEGMTPLVALVFHRDDTDDTVAMAQVLLDFGADVNTPATKEFFEMSPVVVAAIGGKALLLSFLVENGGDIEYCPSSLKTGALGMAAAEGWYACVAVLAHAADAQGKSIIDTTNRLGRTPCYMAMSKGHAEVVGLLARAGADLRRTSPLYYVESGPNLHPSPILKVHYALDKTIRSFTTKTCAECGEFHEMLLHCSQCNMAFFCNRDCQRKCWPSHKKCCGQLTLGASLYAGEGPVPDPPSEPFGFASEFGPRDSEIKDAKVFYLPDHPIWEYDAGSRGHPDWRRYPAFIEDSIEQVKDSGRPRATSDSDHPSPVYAYTPGDPSCAGNYEPGTISSSTPPQRVATCNINFAIMVEREVYTGASRSVRRNGKRSPR